MRILLIESEAAARLSLELTLRAEGHNVYSTDLGEEGADLAKIYEYDLIVSEIGLSDMHGVEMIRHIRVSKVSTPILVLSTFADIETKVRAINAGADDYMTKPFHRDEFVARVVALVRRSRGIPESLVRFGLGDTELVVNLKARNVSMGGKVVHLTGKEYCMIELMALRPGVTCTKEMFLNHLYGGMDEPELKIIDVFICKLRKKLIEASNGMNYVETLWGRGYALVPPIPVKEYATWKSQKTKRYAAVDGSPSIVPAQNTALA